MAGLIEDDTDVEVARYEEAYQIKTYSGLSPANLRGGMVQYDPINKVEAVYIDLPSGGKLRVGDRPVTPMQVAQTDAMASAEAAVSASEDISTFAENYKRDFGKDPAFEDYGAAGYTEAQALQYEQLRTQQFQQDPNIADVVRMTPDQVQQYSAQPGAETVAPQGAGVRGSIQDWIFNALDPRREPTGGAADALRSAFSMLPGTDNLDPGDLRFFSNLFTDAIDLGVPAVGAAISGDEGIAIIRRGGNQLLSGDPNQMTSGAIDTVMGFGLAAFGAAEFVPLLKSLSDPAKDMLKQMSPEAKNLMADAIGLSRAISQGDKDMLMEIFQPRGTPQSLSAGAASPKIQKDILELNLKAEPKLAELFSNSEVTADSPAEEIASTLLRAQRSGIIDPRTANEILGGMKGQ